MKIAIATVIALGGALLLTFASNSFAQNRNNPQNDRRVQEGFDRTQREIREQRERRERDDAAQRQDGQPRNFEQWQRNQYPQGDNDHYGVKRSHDQPQN